MEDACRESIPMEKKAGCQNQGAQKDVSWLTEVQKGVIKDRSQINKKYSKMA